MEIVQIINSLIQILGKELNVVTISKCNMRIKHDGKLYKIFFESPLVEKVNNDSPFLEDDEFSIWLTSELINIKHGNNKE